MKITEVAASRTVRINLGDYQSTDFFVSMKAEVFDGEKRTDAARSLHKLIDRVLLIEVARHFKARGKTVKTDELRKRYGFQHEGT